MLAGLNQQVKAETITSIIDFPSGGPADLVVTNAAATFGAANEETDITLRARARAFWSTARRGTLSAIKQGALAVPGIETASCFELVDPNTGYPDYLVELNIFSINSTHTFCLA